MGGSNEPSNLVELSIDDHAKAHKKLWEEHGKIEDYVAWRGLAGLISKKELLHELFVLAGKKSRPPIGHKANLGRKWSDEYKQKMSSILSGRIISKEWKNKISEGNSRDWKITNPNGETFIINNLQKFCSNNNLDSSKMSLVAAGIRNHHKKYLCEKLG